ncbi:MAG: CDP-diacylglycerol--glycerol-3-phosphate 3-phosphatidyltransferase [Acutalibacteraceae bacterium]
MINKNIPNRLTIVRIIMTPIFLGLFLSDLPHAYLWGFMAFGLGSITDFLDGFLARKYNIVTVFGQLADPVADKILTTSALLAFMQLGLCNIWIIVIVLLREFTITSIRLVATSQGVVIPANIYGKIKTISQMVFSVIIMLLAELNYCGLLGESFPLSTVSNCMLWVTAVLCVVSGIIYIKEATKIIDITK